MVKPTPASTQMIQKQVRIKEELEVSPPKRELKCSFCREGTHSYQTCQVFKQMVIKQAEELTFGRVAEYEKSQEETIRCTVLEEYGPAISMPDPANSRKSSAFSMVDCFSKALELKGEYQVGEVVSPGMDLHIMLAIGQLTSEEVQEANASGDVEPE